MARLNLSSVGNLVAAPVTPVGAVAPLSTQASSISSILKPMLTAKEVGELMRRSTRTVRRWEVDGKLPPAVRFGRSKLWSRDAIVNLIGQ